jgi:uncharacterized membrane protein YfcA
MTTQLIITILLIGLAAGILSGLVGVGGGIILVPALVLFLGHTQHQAQGTSLAVLTLPVFILASIKYYIDSKAAGTPIDLKVVGLLALGFVGGGYIGSSLALRIDQEMLKKIFAVILFYTAFKMLGWDAVITRWVRSLF